MTMEEKLNSIIKLLEKSAHAPSKKSREPYYTERDAVWFRDNVLAPILAGSRRVTIESDIDRSLKTLACVFSQARKYLFAHLDPEGKWKQVWNCTHVSTERNKRYIFTPKFNVARELRIVTPWPYQVELDAWLNALGDAAEGTMEFKKEGLSLPSDDIDKLKDMLLQYKDLLTYYVAADKVLIVNIPTKDETTE